jgi:hypothetical protein
MTSEEIIGAAKVPNTKSVFVLGCLESRVTVYAQQVRALNLIDAIIEKGLVRSNGRVAIIGGGAAGITAAAALALAMPDLRTIDVYEQKDDLLHLQLKSPDRYLHPHIYDWPNRGSLAPEAGLPILNWTAGTAGEVAAQILASFDAIRMHTRTIHTKPASRVERVQAAPIEGCRIFVAGDHRGGEFYDIAILSVGFGYERLITEKNRSYWDPHQLSGPIRKDEPLHHILVSGNGDGGLLDFITVAFQGVSHREILDFITRYPGIDAVARALREVEEKAWSVDESAIDIYEQYNEHVLTVLPNNLLLEVAEKLRPSVTVFFHTRDEHLFRRDTAVLNRFAVFLAITAAKNSLRNTITVVRKAKFACDPMDALVKFDSGEQVEPSFRFLRFGADTAKNLNPFADHIGILRAARGDLRTGYRPATPPLTESAKARFAFLGYASQASTKALIGDLTIFGGRMLVTREQLLDPNVRLYGRTFGRASLAEVAARLPPHGSNLGADLGLGPLQIPIGYLFMDRLFAPRLTLVTERGLSDQWKGLEINGEYFLLPFRLEILDLLSPDELLASTQGQRDRTGDHYIISLKFGSVDISQPYSISGPGDYTLDSVTIPPEHLDIRLFPNFDLDSVEGSPNDNSLPPEDRRYFARVRVNPLWNFGIVPFRHDAEQRTVTIQANTEVRLGPARSDAERGVYHPGQVLVFTLDEKPSGFYVEDRGLCLVEFPVAQGTPAEWEVGVDFGTSNTCVTYRIEDDTAPRVLRFPVLTTTLLREPGYSAEFDGPGGTTVNEGASALLDFFFNLSNADDGVTPNDYFPTQVVTRHTYVRMDWKWEYEGGLIHFKNVFLSPIIRELIDGFPNIDVWGVPRHGKTFRLKQDIKGGHTSWLKVFMRHLRKEVLMAAARERGTVKRFHFSYPNAFNFTQREKFLQVLQEVWNPAGHTEVMVTVSESEAVRNYLVRNVPNANEYVVFDVSGRTTDVIGFSMHEPIFWTSFKLAADHINRYVVRSSAFRAAFLDAFIETVPYTLDHISSRLFREEESTAGQRLLTIWLGLLELIEQNDFNGHKIVEILSVLRRRSGDAVEPGVRAIRGFFLSLSLLFGGLSYYAGLLIRAASEGKFDGRAFDRRLVELVLTGNGGKFYSMLDHPDAPFDSVMQGMFISGCAARDDVAPTSYPPDLLAQVEFAGLFRLNGRVAPKVIVALGLLSAPPRGTYGEQRPVPLANILGEDGYEIEGKPAKFDADLISFYRGIEPVLRTFTPPDAPPRQLVRCLEALNELLPSGMNRGVRVIPRAGNNWHREILNGLYERSKRNIRASVKENATELVRDLMENRISYAEVPAQEPLFIVQLVALLDRIREEFA